MGVADRNPSKRRRVSEHDAAQLQARAADAAVIRAAIRGRCTEAAELLAAEKRLGGEDIPNTLATAV